MAVLRNIISDFEIYEYQEEGMLVAVNRDGIKEIKSYFKKNKGKKDKPEQQVSGHPFILDEEQDSLKIDFSQTQSYPIAELQKFK